MRKDEMAVARLAASEAGRILTQKLGRVNRIIKKGEIDLVTEVDMASEKAIVSLISGHFPQDTILTEESGEYRHRPERVWIIDPLDGTTNFTHNFPFFAVSIALAVEGELVAGVVFNPRMNEFFEATKGGGAFLNHKPITTSQTLHIGDALLSTGFPYDIHERPKGVISRFKRLIVLAQGIRRPGSAALDLCYVAAGIFDGFWEQDLKPWDTAAGTIILSEAGGKVSTYEGDPYTPYKKNIVASNAHIHSAMVAALSE